MGKDLRLADGDRLTPGSAGALPADEHERCPRRRIHPGRRLSRSEPADVLARRCSAPTRRADRGAHERHGHRDTRRTRCRRRDRQGADRMRGRRRRGGNVRAGDRTHGRRRSSDHPVRPPVPDHRAVHAAARAAADAARPRQPHLLPQRGRRARDGRLRAQACPLGARRHPRGLRGATPARGVGPYGGALHQRDRAGSGNGDGRGEEVLQRAGGLHAGRGLPARRDRRFPASGSRPEGARTGLPAPVASAR